MVTTDATLDQLARGKEKLEERNKVCLTSLYEALDIFELHRFKQLLIDTGLSEILQQPGSITVFVPTDEALQQLDSLISSEVSAEKRQELLQIFVRSHIATCSVTKIFDRWSGSDSLDAMRDRRIKSIYDMNGDIIEFDWNSGRCFFLLNSVNGVRPLNYGTSGSAGLSNGNLTIMPDIFIGKTFLEHKYSEIIYRQSLIRAARKNMTTWESLTTLGLSTFCDAVQAAGLDPVLKEPPEAGQRVSVCAPVDEAFRRVRIPGTNSAKELSKLQRFIKSQININGRDLNGNLIGDLLTPERYVADMFYYPESGFSTSNGSFSLMRKSFLHEKPVGWQLNPTPYPNDN